MKKIIRPLTVLLMMTILVLAELTPSNEARADTGECFARMSEETARYVREMRIPLKGADSEFYASKAEQVYLLNSEETLNLSAGRTFKNTVAVINYKDARGGGGFYVIEQEITPGKITFFLKKDSEVLESRPVKLFVPRGLAGRAQGPGQPCNQSDCDSINNDTRAKVAALAVEANRTCTTQHTCLPFCNCFAGKLSVAPTIIDVPPSSWRCRTTWQVKYAESQFWIKKINGPLLIQAFDVAIKKEAGRYTF